MILADTTVLIDIQRGKNGVKKKISEISTKSFGISEITIQELYAGLGYTKAILGDEVFNKQKAKIDEILEDFNIIPISRRILEIAGLKEGFLKSQGITIDIQDIIIGITAEIYKAEKILTRNPTHFEVFSIPKETYSS